MQRELIKDKKLTHTQTHTHSFLCVCVCVFMSVGCCTLAVSMMQRVISTVNGVLRDVNDSQREREREREREEERA